MIGHAHWFKNRNVRLSSGSARDCSTLLSEQRVGHARCLGRGLATRLVGDEGLTRWGTHDKMGDPSCQMFEVLSQYYRSWSARRRSIVPRSYQGDLTTCDVTVVQ